MPQIKSASFIREYFEANPADDPTNPALDAFREGNSKFQGMLTQDPRKRTQSQKAPTMEAVLEAAEAAQKTYENKNGQTKTKERLRKFCGLLQHYGNVMDVLVQHHPEYVSLAWGAMKFVFGTFLNHEATISTLVKGLCKIGNTLPRIRLAVTLYPTRRMKHATSSLYACIIRFLIRAHDWYQENWLQHVWHSVTRPVELRYNDILEEIEIGTQTVYDLTVAGAQAEQRVMHDEQAVMHKKIDAEGSRVIALEAEIQELKALFISFNSMASASFLDTNQRLTDLQVSSVLDYVAQVPISEPSKALRLGIFMRGRRQLKQSAKTPDYTWLSPRLHTWSAERVSSLITVRGGFRSRFDMRDLSVELVRLLQESGIPVLWALKSTNQDKIGPQQPSVVDILKYLTSQALRLTSAAPTEASMSSVCMRFKAAKTEDEWLSILASVIPRVPVLYFVIDVEILNSAFAGVPASFWPAAFFNIFTELEKRGMDTSVKVALISYGPVTVETCSDTMGNSHYWVSTVRAPPGRQAPGSKRGAPGGMSRKGPSWAQGSLPSTLGIRFQR